MTNDVLLFTSLSILHDTRAWRDIGIINKMLICSFLPLLR